MACLRETACLLPIWSRLRHEMARLNRRGETLHVVAVDGVEVVESERLPFPTVNHLLVIRASRWPLIHADREGKRSNPTASTTRARTLTIAGRSGKGRRTGAE